MTTSDVTAQNLFKDIFDMSPAGGNNVESMDDTLAERLMSFLSEAEGKDKDKAKYKLEVSFTETRSAHQAYAGMLFAWVNEGFDSGGGDEGIHFCPAKLDTGRVCAYPIEHAFISKGVALCPECKQTTKPRDLVGQVFFRLRTQQWVEVLVKYYKRLDENADIRLCTMDGDLHGATERLMAGNPDNIRQHRRNRDWVIYPHENIVRDMLSGASLEGRIRAFLEA